MLATTKTLGQVEKLKEKPDITLTPDPHHVAVAADGHPYDAQSLNSWAAQSWSSPTS